MNPLHPVLAERARQRCEYSRAPEQVFNFAFEVEHIQPRAAGGDDALDNLALSCESCNLFKADAVTGWDEVTAQHVPLFHPRRNRWEEHFFFETDTAEIHGRTSTGRATIERLKMNSTFQTRARGHWVRLGLYP